MIGNLPTILWVGFIVLIVCQVSSTSEVPEANLPDVSNVAKSLCDLTKTCTILGNKLGDHESDFRAKQRICQLADQASLLPDETKCEEPDLELSLDDVTSANDGEDLAETLCDLSTSCVMLALTPHAQDPDHEPMKTICKLAGLKMKTKHNITCKPIEPEDSLSDEDSERQSGQELRENQDDQPQVLTLTPVSSNPEVPETNLPDVSKVAKFLCKLTKTCNTLEPDGSLSDGDSGRERGEELRENQDDRLQELTLRTTQHYGDDCSEIYAAQTWYSTPRTGVYTIRPVSSGAFPVYCDMSTDGGGWTVIQNRFDGTIHFNREFNDYKYGFGSASGEHWLGLQNMYRITAQNTYELYVELVDWSDNVRYAKYSSFRVGGGDYYQLSLGTYSGNAGDSLTYHNGMKFSAEDHDQDTHSDNCAGKWYGAGGWWYKACAYSALNGPYLRPSDRTSNSGYGIWWGAFSPSTYRTYLKRSKMMIRPTDFRTGKLKHCLPHS
ncbi:uncharacterized protein LOC144860039 [Branchiostoma floridae x Branchiostoma japonicum]